MLNELLLKRTPSYVGYSPGILYEFPVFDPELPRGIPEMDTPRVVRYIATEIGESVTWSRAAKHGRYRRAWLRILIHRDVLDKSVTKGLVRDETSHGRKLWICSKEAVDLERIFMHVGMTVPSLAANQNCLLQRERERVRDCIIMTW